MFNGDADRLHLFLPDGGDGRHFEGLLRVEGYREAVGVPGVGEEVLAWSAS